MLSNSPINLNSNTSLSPHSSSSIESSSVASIIVDADDGSSGSSCQRANLPVEVGDQSLCAWCRKVTTKMFTLSTHNGVKVFCSELCFNLCRKTSYKKNKVCDWCKHIRHTVNYVDFQDGTQQLQFCSDKCLNQYKMNVFCRETQAHLTLTHPHLSRIKSTSSVGPASSSLITPELWLQESADSNDSSSPLDVTSEVDCGGNGTAKNNSNHKLPNQKEHINIASRSSFSASPPSSLKDAKTKDTSKSAAQKKRNSGSTAIDFSVKNCKSDENMATINRQHGQSSAPNCAGHSPMDLGQSAASLPPFLGGHFDPKLVLPNSGLMPPFHPFTAHPPTFSHHFPNPPNGLYGPDFSLLPNPMVPFPMPFRHPFASPFFDMAALSPAALHRPPLQHLPSPCSTSAGKSSSPVNGHLNPNSAAHRLVFPDKASGGNPYLSPILLPIPLPLPIPIPVVISSSSLLTRHDKSVSTDEDLNYNLDIPPTLKLARNFDSINCHRARPVNGRPLRVDNLISKLFCRKNWSSDRRQAEIKDFDSGHRNGEETGHVYHTEAIGKRKSLPDGGKLFNDHTESTDEAEEDQPNMFSSERRHLHSAQPNKRLKKDLILT